MSGPSVRGPIYVSAGEPSGDLHASAVVRIMRERGVQDVRGMGGPLMQQNGARLDRMIDTMSAIGFAEIVASIPRHAVQLARTRSLFRDERLSLALLVDYPGYHLRLARAARKSQIPVLYYIAPQLWAWGGSRIRTMRQTVTHIAAILPFEQEFFARRGIPTTFVGHPLLDRATIPTREDARKRLGVGANDPVLALFPGSRITEIQRLWPTFLQTAVEIRRCIPDLRVIVGASAAFRPVASETYQVVDGETFTVMAAADVVLTKSGTATLEAALVGRPTCIAYRMHWSTYQVARRVLTCDHVGLVNILLGRGVVPEFIQHHAKPQRLAEALIPLFDADGPQASAQLEAMSEVRERLGTPGAARRVSDLVLELAA